MTPKQKFIIALLGVVVATVPSCFSFLRARQDAELRQDQVRVEAERSYTTLVGNVTALQGAISDLHTSVLHLEGQLMVLQRTVPGGHPMPASVVVLPDFAELPAYHRLQQATP